MKNNLGIVLRYIALLASIPLMSGCVAKLIDLDKSLPKLNLTEEQREVVEPKMKAIKEIVDEYNAEKEQIEEQLSDMRGSMGGGRGGMMSGGRGGMGRGGREAGGEGGSGPRGKLQEFRNKRETYLSAINVHIEDIKSVLNEDQLAVFEKMKMPELEMPEMPQRGGRGGMGGGMGGRGGGRRGGGMF
jgi:uncharacterized membrane protein YgcG